MVCAEEEVEEEEEEREEEEKEEEEAELVACFVYMRVGWKGSRRQRCSPGRGQP